MLPPQSFSEGNGKGKVDRQLLARALADVEASKRTDLTPRTHEQAQHEPAPSRDTESK